MKNKAYNKIMLLVCCIIVTSCNFDKKLSSEMVRNLNPTKEPLQESPVYKHVEIIKLETSPSSFISHINRIEMNDSIIFVSEFDKLYAFTREGKFISQISKKGEGPQEYLVLSSFYVNNEKRQVTIVDNVKNVFINFDYKGKYVSTSSIPPGAFKSSHYTLMTKGNYLLSHNMMDMNDTEAYSLFDMDTQNVKQYFSYQPITVGNYKDPFSWNPMARDGGDIDLIMPLCDTIYTYSTASSSFEVKYVIEIPQKMIPKEKIRKNTPSFLGDIFKLSEKGFFKGFTGIFETDTKVLLECSFLEYFLFDKSSRAGHYYSSISSKNDTVLPFFPTIYAYKNVFVGCAQPGKLLELENLHDKKVLESIKGLQEDDNPCLILYELE